MVRGSTYSAILHITILAVIVLGLPSLTFLLPKLQEQQPPELQVVLMSEQDTTKLTEAAKEAARKDKEAKETARPKESKAPPPPDEAKEKSAPSESKTDPQKEKAAKNTPEKKKKKKKEKEKEEETEKQDRPKVDAEKPPQPDGGGSPRTAKKEPDASTGLATPKDHTPRSSLSGRSVVKDSNPRAETDDERTTTRNPAAKAEDPDPTAGTGDDVTLTSAQSRMPRSAALLPRAGSSAPAPQQNVPPTPVQVSFPTPEQATESGQASAEMPASSVPASAAALRQPADPTRPAELMSAPAAGEPDSSEGKTSPPPQSAVQMSGISASPPSPDGEIAVARQGAASATPKDAVSTLMAQFAEQVPRLKGLREAIRNPGSSRSNPAIEQSVKRMEERSEEGYAHAQFSLAEMQLTGEGLPQNPKKAIELLTRAAMSGYLPAQLTLGMLAAEGTAMERNLAEAHTWLSVAAEQGHKAAKEVLPRLEKHMSTRDTVESHKRSFQLHQVLVIIHGGDLNKASKSELSDRLRVAAALGDVESVYVLLAQGADADGSDLDGRTALIEAAWRGYPKIVKSLIDNGASLSSSDNTKKNALMWAAINGHADVIANLIAAGSALDEQDSEGISALMRAAWNGHAEAVKVLLNAGAKAGLKDKKGLTALDYAGKAGNKIIQQLLRERASRG